MSFPAVLLCLAVFHQEVDKPTLYFYQDSLIIRQGERKEAVPLQLTPKKPPLSVMYRRNKTFAVWDDRGLTVRIGKKVRSSFLPDISVSPRVFPRPEILKTIDLIHKGKRKKKASALSGARRMGNSAYFLVRWDDSDAKPWLEALVSVDLTDPKAEPRLVARLPGHSLATLPLDDRLTVVDGKLAVLAVKGSNWGAATFDPDLRLFVFQPLGQKLQSYTPINSRLGAFVEGTDYGTFIAGRVDLVTRTRKSLVESKGSVKFLDGLDPLMVVVSHADSVIVDNTVTGAEVRLPASSALRRTSQGIAVWSPYDSPKRAWLYDPVRWDTIAQWPAETPGGQQRPPGASGR